MIDSDFIFFLISYPSLYSERRLLHCHFKYICIYIICTTQPYLKIYIHVFVLTDCAITHTQLRTIHSAVIFYSTPNSHRWIKLHTIQFCHLASNFVYLFAVVVGCFSRISECQFLHGRALPQLTVTATAATTVTDNSLFLRIRDFQVQVKPLSDPYTF